MPQDPKRYSAKQEGNRAGGNTDPQEYSQKLPLIERKKKVKLNAGAIVTVLLIVAILAVVILIASDIMDKKTAPPQIREMEVPHSAATGNDPVRTQTSATPVPLRPESAGEGLLPVFYRANTQQRKLALTVSGTLTESQMGKLVTAASQVGAKLTFFPTGEEVEKNVPMWAQVNLMGHEIESAGYSGVRYLTLGEAEKIDAELEKACTALRDWIHADYQLHFLRTNDLYDDEYLLLHRTLDRKGFYGIARQALQMNRLVTDEDIVPGMIINMEIGSLNIDDLCRTVSHLDEMGYTLVTMNELFEYPPNYLSSAGDEESDV